MRSLARRSVALITLALAAGCTREEYTLEEKTMHADDSSWREYGPVPVAGC